MAHASPRVDALALAAAATDAPRARTSERWGWLELFAVIQLAWGVLLFLPDVQPYRMFIRAVPYVSSLVALAAFAGRAGTVRMASSGTWLLASLLVLAANLLHPETRFAAGLAQIAFQVSIAAPMFWVAWTMPSEARLERLLRIVFGASLVSAALGILQVYHPDWFLPPEFSALARRLSPLVVSALSYDGPDGHTIIRPPGLSDMPGGAAVAGLTAALFGVAYASRDRASAIGRVFSAAAAGIGMTVLYLTQVRSLTVTAAFAVLLFALIRLRQGRILRGGWIVLGGSLLVAASFMWAAAIGGKSIETRYAGLIEAGGLFSTFQQSRGLFLEYTFRELLFRFPLGAGLGRWGMMEIYFPDPSMWHAPPIHVEIQITGWLLDGGVLMWLCYGGALASAMRLAYRAAVDRSRPSLRDAGAIVLTFQLAIIGLCLTGPVFNTQLGVVLWMMTGALWGAMRGRP